MGMTGKADPLEHITQSLQAPYCAGLWHHWDNQPAEAGGGPIHSSLWPLALSLNREVSILLCRLVASLGIADPLKPEAHAAVAALQAAGLPCHLLTGDNWVTARVVAAQLDIRHVQAEVDRMQPARIGSCV